MSIFDPERPDLRIRIPSYRRTLGDAARFERDVLLILRDVFPDASEWIVTGEPSKPMAVNLEDEAAFIDMIVKLRRTGPRSDFRDTESRFYTTESIPNLYTAMNFYFTPNPKKPLRPHPDRRTSWNLHFSVGKAEGSYEHIVIEFPYHVAQSRQGIAQVEMLMEQLILFTNPEDARFAIIHFDKAFWESNHRIGWLTYLSQPPLVDQLKDDPRTRPFHRGIMLKLSDDPLDMLDDSFVSRSFEFGQSLIPYWPPQLYG